MTRFLTLAAVVLLVTPGCQELAPEAVRQALPTAESVAIEVPESAEAQVAIGAIADTYRWTRATTRGLNGLTGLILVTVHTVVQFPPTSIDGDTYTWGPHADALDPAEWMLRVSDLGDGTYDWKLFGRPRNQGGEFEVLIDGHAVAGSTPHRGAGEFVFDLDALHRVNPIDNPDAAGVLTVAYDLELSGLAMVRMELDADVSAKYRYDEAADGSGSFQFEFAVDIEENQSLLENARIRARWNAEGAGRADVTATGGDLESMATLSQCWNNTFRSVYEDVDIGLSSVTDGDPAECVFTDLDLPDDEI